MALKREKDCKRVNEMEMMRIFNRFDSRSLGIGLLTGFILISLTYITVSKTDTIRYPFFNSRLAESLRNTSFSIPSRESVSSDPQIDNQNLNDGLTNECGTSSSSCELNPSNTTLDNSSPISRGIHVTVNSNNPLSKQSEPENKPLCDFSHRRSAICDIEGDIRITGNNSSSVILISSKNLSTSNNNSWKVQPYPRKYDAGALTKVTVVNVEALDPTRLNEAPECSVNHSVPAVVFSIAGHTGNFFHDMTDVLVPLFQTARQFNGRVQLLVTNYKQWWIGKYSPFIKRLSNYQVIDYDTDDRVHCFTHAIVGLRSDKDMSIDPTKSPNGYTMLDFTKFMRDSYGLERDRALKVGENGDKRPRLLLVARGKTRRFVNLDAIVDSAQRNGFEVVVAEANFNKVAEFSRIVNSCDVLMGVHGAGLTNFVFLPVNSVLIQIVPFGLYDWVAGQYFGEPTKNMNLSYVEYKMSVEESTLNEIYSRDDPVIKDPKSVQKLGWKIMGDVYLEKQDVRLDVQRFEPVLQQAFRLLHY